MGCVKLAPAVKRVIHAGFRVQIITKYILYQLHCKFPFHRLCSTQGTFVEHKDPHPGHGHEGYLSAAYDTEAAHSSQGVRLLQLPPPGYKTAAPPFQAHEHPFEPEIMWREMA